MQESPTQNDLDVIPEYPELPTTCPISSLLGTRIVDMSDSELEKMVSDLRAARETPAMMRTLLQGKEKRVAKPKTPKKINLNDLF